MRSDMLYTLLCAWCKAPLYCQISCQRLTPAVYQHKSALAALQGHPVLQAELERVREGKPMEALDVTRYRLDKPPLARRNDFAAWRKALENAHSQLGHQYNRCGGQTMHASMCRSFLPHATLFTATLDLGVPPACAMSICRVINLELLLKFGPKAWRVQNASLGAANARCAPVATNTAPCYTAAFWCAMPPLPSDICMSASAACGPGSAPTLSCNAVQAFARGGGHQGAD
jgi:Breast carcinoma amplified sequence 2 (BCAS2)